MVEAYLSRTARSKALHERARQVLPAGVSYNIRLFAPYPFYAQRGVGGHLYDVDGNEYIDFWVGHGALIFGHCHPPIVRAIQEQASLGAHLGFAHEWEVIHAEQVIRMVPSAQMVRFTNSGTEANLYAARLARAFTHREKIAKCEGGWHGSYDALHLATSWPLDIYDTAGVAQGAQKDTVVLPFNDLEGAARLIEKNELAAVVVEPVQGAAGFVPAERDFLVGLRQLCDKTSALLIFDEVITGFRLAPGGGQEFYSVFPDLTVLGKIVGGGSLPAGAVCGRAEIMTLIDPHLHPQKSERVFHGGTYSGNPLMTRAGYTTLKELEEKRGHVYPQLNRLGEKAREGLARIFQKTGVDAHVTGVGSLMGIHFTKEKPRDIRQANATKNAKLTEQYFQSLLSQGIAFVGPAQAHLLLCTAHQDADIDRLLKATEIFLNSTAGTVSG